MYSVSMANAALVCAYMLKNSLRNRCFGLTFFLLLIEECRAQPTHSTKGLPLGQQVNTGQWSVVQQLIAKLKHSQKFRIYRRSRKKRTTSDYNQFICQQTQTTVNPCALLYHFDCTLRKKKHNTPKDRRQWKKSHPNIDKYKGARLYKFSEKGVYYTSFHHSGVCLFVVAIVALNLRSFLHILSMPFYLSVFSLHSRFEHFYVQE